MSSEIGYQVEQHRKLQLKEMENLVKELQESNRVILQMIEDEDPELRTELVNRIQAHLMGV